MINYTPQDLLEILLEMGNEGELTVPQKPKSQVIQESHGKSNKYKLAQKAWSLLHTQ